MLDDGPTTHAVAYLLKKARKPLDYRDIILMLYKTDRIRLQEDETKLTGDTPIATEMGPMLYNTLARMQGKTKSDFWNYWINPIQHNMLTLTQKGETAPLGELSEDNRDILDNVFANYTHKTNEQEIKSEFPEWDKPEPNEIKPIRLERILREIGTNPKRIPKLVKDIEDKYDIRAILAENKQVNTKNRTGISNI